MRLDVDAFVDGDDVRGGHAVGDEQIANRVRTRR